MRQLRYYRMAGKVPVAGRRQFGDLAEARAYRAEQARLWDDFDWDSYSYV